MRIALILVLVLCGTLSPTRAAQDAQHLIRPGVGIGPITLGMQLSEVVAILGAPYYERGAILGVLSVATETEYCWIDASSDRLVTGGLCVDTPKTKRIVTAVAAVGDGSYQTAEGLHTSTYRNGEILPGSTEVNVRAALGPPLGEDDSHDPDFRRFLYTGLTVDVDDRGYVWRIVVR